MQSGNIVTEFLAWNATSNQIKSAMENAARNPFGSAVECGQFSVGRSDNTVTKTSNIAVEFRCNRNENYTLLFVYDDQLATGTSIDHIISVDHCYQPAVKCQTIYSRTFL